MSQITSDRERADFEDGTCGDNNLSPLQLGALATLGVAVIISVAAWKLVVSVANKANQFMSMSR